MSAMTGQYVLAWMTVSDDHCGLISVGKGLNRFSDFGCYLFVCLHNKKSNITAGVSVYYFSGSILFFISWCKSRFFC